MGAEDKRLTSSISGEIVYVKTSDILSDARAIIDEAALASRRAINITLVRRNWMLGRRIHDEELEGQDRAAYGKQVIKNLSKNLSAQYGRGFDQRSLYRFLRFYETYPNFLTTALSKSGGLLSWSHYIELLRVDRPEARTWYEKESIEQGWSVRTLQRNISTLYYDRLLASGIQQPVIDEMRDKTSEYEQNRLDFIKNPVIAEFLGVPQDKSFLETDLEQAIIDNLQQFLMEMGKGYAFVARQQHIRTELDDYYIDLVFYNYILKCFVLIDLKTSKITHQDVGQMDMYVRMYDELKRTEGDNPTLGIVLCTQTDEDIARYSVLHDNQHLFMAKYKLYLPNEDALRAEIEHEKAMFALQHNDDIAADGADNE